MAAAVYKTQEEFGQYIRLHFAVQDIPEQTVVSGMLTLKVLRVVLLKLMQFLRDDPACRFTQLTDITCVHYPDRQDGFVLTYHLLSPVMGRRIRIKAATQEDVPVMSVSSVFPNAAWYEREVREMFGVSFEGHPDLRRLLTCDERVAFPLRKSYPAEGTVRLVYDETKQCFVFLPLEKEKNAAIVSNLDQGEQ